MLGTDQLNSYLSKYRIALDPQLEALVGRYSLFFWCYYIEACSKLAYYSLHDVENLKMLRIRINCLNLWFVRHHRKPWAKFINQDNRHLVSPEVLLGVTSFYNL